MLWWLTRMRQVLALLAIFLAATCTQAAEVHITACGQVVPPHQVGVLDVDLLNCPNPPGAVGVGDRATLWMNNHSINGPADAFFPVGVRCGASCTVLGPGDIGNVATAIFAGFGCAADRCPPPVGRVTVDGITVHDTSRDALSADLMVRATNVVLTRCAVGIRVPRVRGANITITDTDYVGIEGDVRLRRLTIVGGPHQGIVGSVRLVDSIVTGHADYDLLTGTRPRLIRSTCGRSARLRQGVSIGSWNVCTDDPRP
jgi:hypothetical protein